MTHQFQMPSYYRSHHYSHQFNLPDSAFANRKLPDYTSEMPQGMQAFPNSHKRHFQQAGYHSIIAEQRIINHQTTEEDQSPAKNREYSRNLSIRDIEGSSTNTLVSQALKNRAKAEFLSKKRDHQVQIEKAQKNRYQSTIEGPQKRFEAIKLIQKVRQQQNYHIRNRRILTEPIESNDPDNSLAINRYREQLRQTDQQISDLHKRLSQVQLESFKSQPEQKRQYKLLNQEQFRLPMIRSSQMDKEKKLKISGSEQAASNFTKIVQARSKALTQGVQGMTKRDGKQKGGIDKIIQSRAYNGAQNELSHSRALAKQLRKMNPTHLSYASFCQ